MLLEPLPRIHARTLRMRQVGRQHLQRLHKPTHHQFTALARHFVLVDVVEAALHLQGEHFALFHSQRAQGRRDLVDRPHAAQERRLLRGIVGVLHKCGLGVLRLLVHQPDHPLEGNDIRFASH